MAPRNLERPGDRRSSALRRVLLATDIFALVCAFVLTQVVLGYSSHGPRSFGHELALLFIAIPCWVLLAHAHNLYYVDTRRTDQSWTEEIAPIIWMTTLWSWGVLLIGSVANLQPSPMKLAAFWAAMIFFLLTVRSIARAWARGRSWYPQNTILVGTLPETQAMVAKILRHPQYGINVVACVELRSDGQSVTSTEIAEAGPVPLIRGETDLLDLLGELDVGRVILGASLHRLTTFKDLLCDLRELPLHIDVVPSWYDVVATRMDLHELEGTPLVAIRNTRLARTSLMFKRALDLVVAIGALIVLAPVILVCAIAIKLDSPGPVLFRQRRVGRDDRRFEVLKFRSMNVNADEVKDEVASLNFHGGGNRTGMFKINGDPRVTRVGRILRRYSLDELPQLFNVVRGDMSLVGPRPLIENEDVQIAGRHRLRITLTPGLTGLWQVNGRSDIPFKDMVDLDYLYVTNWSLWGDVKILLKTFSAVARGHGAY